MTDKAQEPKQHAEKERERIKEQEDKVVVNSDESFPASDPPSFNPGVTGPGDVKKKKEQAK
jgi:hypothetical protein